MEVTKEDLRAHYAALSDDELATIYTTSDLTAIAKEVIELEISARNIGTGDFAAALEADRIVTEDRVDFEEIAEEYRWYSRALSVGVMKGTIIGVVLGLLIFAGFQVAILLFR